MNEFQSLKEFLLVLTVTLPRLVGVFAILPFLNSQLIQGLVRNTILISLALVLFPLVLPQFPPGLGIGMVIAVVFKELFIGIGIGFVVSILFWTVESIGYFIDNQRGTTMAAVLDPMSGQQTSPLGSMLLQTMVVWFFSSGGFLLLLDSLLETYKIWPVFSFFPGFGIDMTDFFLGQADTLMRLTVLFAAPVVITVFVCEFGLGLINRFAPQLNVFFLSMPIKSAVAGFVMILYFMTMLTFFKEHFTGLASMATFLGGIFHE